MTPPRGPDLPPHERPAPRPEVQFSCAAVEGRPAAICRLNRSVLLRGSPAPSLRLGQASAGAGLRGLRVKCLQQNGSHGPHGVIGHDRSAPARPVRERRRLSLQTVRAQRSPQYERRGALAFRLLPDGPHWVGSGPLVASPIQGTGNAGRRSLGGPALLGKSTVPLYLGHDEQKEGEAWIEGTWACCRVIRQRLAAC
jgi:hypothetical protein